MTSKWQTSGVLSNVILGIKIKVQKKPHCYFVLNYFYSENLNKYLSCFSNVNNK